LFQFVEVATIGDNPRKIKYLLMTLFLLKKIGQNTATSKLQDVLDIAKKIQKFLEFIYWCFFLCNLQQNFLISFLFHCSAKNSLFEEHCMMIIDGKCACFKLEKLVRSILLWTNRLQLYFDFASSNVLLQHTKGVELVLLGWTLVRGSLQT